MSDAPASRTNRLGRSPLVFLLLLYGVGLAAIVLWPTTVSSSFADLLEGLNDAVPNSVGLVEFAANVALFVPIGLFSGLGPKPRYRIGLAGGAAISISAELVQAALLPQRVASVLDVVANVAGVSVGLVWAALLTAGTRPDSSRRSTVMD
jgi:VanZ family protein